MAKIRTLRRCALFRGLQYRDLAILAPYVKEEKAKAKSWLSESGKPTRGLVVIKSGRVKLIAGDTDGSEMEIGSGEFFGELALADGDQTRAVGAQAIDSCEFLRIDPEGFRALMSKSPDVAGKLAQGILSAVSEKMVGVRTILGELIGATKAH